MPEFTRMSLERKVGLGAYYNGIQGKRGFTLAPHHYPLVAALEDDRIVNFLGMLPAGGGKSNLVDIVYPSWLLGHDPTLAILSVSAGERLPQTFLQATMQVITHDPTFRRFFPDVQPDVGVGWSLERGLYVTGRHPGDENPSYFCAGLGSKALTGLHARVMVFDDLHDEENSRTPEGRAEVVQRYYRTLLDRADPRGCRRVAIGRWWAEDDLYQEWMKSGDWVVAELPATRPGVKELYYDVMVPADVICVFDETGEPAPPEDYRLSDPPGAKRYRVRYAAMDRTGQGFYWPASPTKRRNYQAVKRRQPRVAAINYDGDMSGGGENVFNEDDFRQYIPPVDLSRGIATPGVQTWIRSLQGVVEAAWDTALGQPRSSSLTAALEAMLVPCKQWHCGEDPNVVGECEFHMDVWLLDLMVRDLDFRELAMALRTRYGLWFPRRVIVEEKQSGVGLLQTFRGTNIPILGQKVEQGKVERAINPVLVGADGLPIAGGAASAQGWAKMGRICVPAGAPWLHGAHGDASEGFIRRVTSFAGGTKNSDEFDVLVHMVNRAIALSRQVAYMPGQPGAGAAQAPQNQWQSDPRAEPLLAFQQATDTDMVQNPFQGLCGAPCHHYYVADGRERCRLHSRVTTAIDGCGDWVKHGTFVEEPV